MVKLGCGVRDGKLMLWGGLKGVEVMVSGCCESGKLKERVGNGID